MRQRLGRFPAYSYRADPAVPAFPDDKALILFDGVCVLCSGFARRVAAADPDGRFRFASAQSPLGTALYRHYGLDAVNYETNLLIADGHASGKMDAAVAIACRLSGWWRLVAWAQILPGGFADRLYDGLAQNRYRLFGRQESCVRPDAKWRDRVIDL